MVCRKQSLHNSNCFAGHSSEEGVLVCPCLVSDCCRPPEGWQLPRQFQSTQIWGSRGFSGSHLLHSSFFPGQSELQVVLTTDTLVWPPQSRKSIDFSTENSAMLQFVSSVILQSMEHSRGYTQQYNRNMRNSSILAALSWDLIFQA